MNSAPANLPATVGVSERAWVTYFKGTLFLIPPLAAVAFVNIFILPKMKQIWGPSPIFDVADVLARNGLFSAFVLVTAIVLLEWLVPAWPKYRRASMGTLVFLLNSATLVLLVNYLVLFAMIAPALVKDR